MVNIFGDDDARETCWDIVSSDTTGPLPSFSASVNTIEVRPVFVGVRIHARSVF